MDDMMVYTVKFYCSIYTTVDISIRLSVVRTALCYLQVIAMRKYLNAYDAIHLKRK